MIAAQTDGPTAFFERSKFEYASLSLSAGEMAARLLACIPLATAQCSKQQHKALDVELPVPVELCAEESIGGHLPLPAPADPMQSIAAAAARAASPVLLDKPASNSLEHVTAIMTGVSVDADAIVCAAAAVTGGGLSTIREHPSHDTGLAMDSLHCSYFGSILGPSAAGIHASIGGLRALVAGMGAVASGTQGDQCSSLQGAAGTSGGSAVRAAERSKGLQQAQTVHGGSSPAVPAQPYDDMHTLLKELGLVTATRAVPSPATLRGPAPIIPKLAFPVESSLGDADRQVEPTTDESTKQGSQWVGQQHLQPLTSADTPPATTTAFISALGGNAGVLAQHSEGPAPAVPGTRALGRLSDFSAFYNSYNSNMQSCAQLSMQVVPMIIQGEIQDTLAADRVTSGKVVSEQHGLVGKAVPHIPVIELAAAPCTSDAGNAALCMRAVVHGAQYEMDIGGLQLIPTSHHASECEQPISSATTGAHTQAMEAGKMTHGPACIPDDSRASRNSGLAAWALADASTGHSHPDRTTADKWFSPVLPDVTLAVVGASNVMDRSSQGRAQQFDGTGLVFATYQQSPFDMPAPGDEVHEAQTVSYSRLNLQAAPSQQHAMVSSAVGSAGPASGQGEGHSAISSESLEQPAAAPGMSGYPGSVWLVAVPGSACQQEGQVLSKEITGQSMGQLAVARSLSRGSKLGDISQRVKTLLQVCKHVCPYVVYG